MQLSEVGKLLQYVNSLERRVMDADSFKTTIAAWHTVVGEFEYQDAMTGVQEYFTNVTSDQRKFFTTGDIVLGARNAKRRRESLRLASLTLDERDREMIAARDKREAEIEARRAARPVPADIQERMRVMREQAAAEQATRKR